MDSHFKSNEILWKNWRPLVLHMRDIQSSEAFAKDSKGRKSAKGFEKYLTHRHVLVTLAVVLDIQVAFKGLSQESQARGSSILGKG